MQINFTDNHEKNLLTELSAEISKSKDVKVAVAFLKYSGYDLIKENIFECLENGGEMEFLVGLDFNTTDAKAIKALQEIESDNPMLRCYCFSDTLKNDTPVFHPKLYLLNNGSQATVIVGSSNLTGGGLKNNIEVNAIIKAHIGHEVISDVYGLYNRIKFRSKLFKPDADYLKNYEKIRQTFKKEYKKYQREPQNIELLAELKQKEEALPKIKLDASALFGWQKTIYDKLPSGIFKTSDIYSYEPEFKNYYPINTEIKAKIRQILQQLRDLGLIKHTKRETWEK
ncbi:MAG: phospholipase D-like domain-containing protein [Candidatus Methanoperedens sp.]